MCIYAMCVTLQKVCLLARQDAQRRVGTTPNMTADQMVEHVLGTMKKEPAAHAEKAVGPMEPADGEQKAVKKVVLKRRRKAVGEMKKAAGEKNSVKKGCFEEAFSCCANTRCWVQLWFSQLQLWLSQMLSRGSDKKGRPNEDQRLDDLHRS